MVLAALDPIVLVLLWGGLALFGRLAKGAQKGPGGTPVPRPPRPQGQPETFEELLAEMRGQLQGAEEPEPRVINERGEVDDWVGVRRETHALPGAEEVEELESWDAVLPVPVSHDSDVRVPGREAADDRSVAFQATIARRLKAAEARNRGRGSEDHRAFDAKIRRTKPVIATARPPKQSLRQAIVWREILGKPIALREHEEL
jgi:hypothetical protein